MSYLVIPHINRRHTQDIRPSWSCIKKSLVLIVHSWFPDPHLFKNLKSKIFCLILLSYSDVIQQVYPDGVVILQEQFSNGNGYIEGNLHLSRQGHSVIAEALCEKINHSLENK